MSIYGLAFCIFFGGFATAFVALGAYPWATGMTACFFLCMAYTAVDAITDAIKESK